MKPSPHHTSMEIQPNFCSEGKARFYAYHAVTVSKKLPIFYNPAMEINRDISLLVLNNLHKEHIHACDLLAGTGVRSLRMIKELKQGKIQSIVANDSNPLFPPLMKKNLKFNTIPQKKIEVRQEDASIMLLSSSGFDYIDIDPFGSPNPFLDAACKRLSRSGILAVTATDTASLCGASPKSCIRKYWAHPRHDYLMQEAGIRILIRKIQLVAAQYEKALIPLYSYSHQHHMRVFLQASKQKSEVDTLLKHHEIWDQSGPLWTGQLWDPILAKKISKQAHEYEKSASLTNHIAGECNIPTIGFFDIHQSGKLLKSERLPKTQLLLNAIKAQGFQAARTHFSESGIRTTMPTQEVLKTIKRIIH